jgi:hypothetical protein
MPEIILLNPAIEWTEFCAWCDCEQRFVAAWQSRAGFFFFCSGCSSEGFRAFTRVTSEAA